MSNFYNRQQKERNSLILGLLFSLFIHGAIAIAASRYKTREFLQVEKEKSITPITIVESAENPNLETSETRSVTASSRLPSPKPSKNSQVTPKPASNTSTPEETAPVNPLPEAKPSIPQQIAETQNKSPIAAAKPDSLSTQNKTPVKSPQTIVKPDTQSDRPPIKPSPKVEATEDIKPIDKPVENNNLAEKPPIIDRPPIKPLPKVEATEDIKPIDKPVKPPKSLLPKKRSPDLFELPSSESSESTTDKDSDSPSETNNTDSEAENPSETTAANSTDNESQPLSISCEDNCQPEYPDVLDGAEGTARVRLEIDRDGKVVNAAIAVSSGNFKLDSEALEAAKQMEFSEIDRDLATVQINLSFAVED